MIVVPELKKTIDRTTHIAQSIEPKFRCNKNCAKIFQVIATVCKFSPLVQHLYHSYVGYIGMAHTIMPPQLALTPQGLQFRDACIIHQH